MDKDAKPIPLGLRDTRGILRNDADASHRKVWGQPNLQLKLHDYLVAHSNVEQVVRELREHTMQFHNSIMATTIDQLPILATLTRLVKAKYVVDLGTFTGISALQLALSIPDDGRVITIDKSDEHLPLAKRYWERAEVSHKIEARLGIAVDVLDNLNAEHYGGKIDFAFIDADKLAYDTYYEKLLILMKPGGLIVMDNVLFFGKVADNAFTDDVTCSMRALNTKLYNDDRIDFSIIPLADGLAVCLVKP